MTIFKNPNISIEVPDGYEPVAYRRPNAGERYISDNDGCVYQCNCWMIVSRMVVRKIEPKRIHLSSLDIAVGSVVRKKNGIPFAWYPVRPDDKGQGVYLMDGHPNRFIPFYELAHEYEICEPGGQFRDCTKPDGNGRETC